MTRRRNWRRLLDHPLVEWALFILGVLLLIVSPLVGIIPGPGGIIVAGVGLALILKTSVWAKRHYVRIKKSKLKAWGWEITVGDFTDRALRRGSARRRRAVRKATERPARN